MGDLGLIPGQEDPLEKEMATHTSVLAWEIQMVLKEIHLQTLWTGVHGLEYWSRWLIPCPADLPTPGIKFASPVLAGRFFKV